MKIAQKPLGSRFGLEEIQAAIEELRPIRLMIRELNYLIKDTQESAGES